MQAPQRMQRSMSFKPSFSIRDRPLSTSTMWNSSGPSRSLGPFGPQWNVVYCVISPPVAERTRSRSIANAWAVEGTSFSMPAVTMCTRGGVVVSSAFPLGRDRAGGAGVGDEKVGARDRNIGQEELVPQLPPRALDH